MSVVRNLAGRAPSIAVQPGRLSPWPLLRVLVALAGTVVVLVAVSHVAQRVG
jgi:hypothetical protein